MFFSPSNIAVQSQPPYALVHARASFIPRSRRWDVSVYVRNLARQQHVTATWLASGDVAFSGRGSSIARVFPLQDELAMLAAAGFAPDVAWRVGPMGVIAARRRSSREGASAPSVRAGTA